MKKWAEILKAFGGVLLVFSAVITFKTNLPNTIENIIYFRGILLGSVCLLIGSAITSNYSISQNILCVLGFSNFMVLIASSYNLVFDSSINLDVYFDVAIFSGIIGIVAIIIIRIWLRRHFLKRH